MTGRGKGKRANTQRGKVNARITRLKHATNGVNIRPSADPPSFVQIPWNSIILSDTVTLSGNQKNYSPTDIHGILIAQIGLVTTSELSYRLREVRAWNLSGNYLNLQCQDLTIGLGAQDYITQVEDQAGRNRWAKVGYIYPTSQQKVSFSSIDTENVFRVGAGTSDKIEVRMHVLWKPRVNTLPNLSRHSKLEQRIAALEARLKDMQVE